MRDPGVVISHWPNGQDGHGMKVWVEGLAHHRSAHGLEGLTARSAGCPVFRLAQLDRDIERQLGYELIAVSQLEPGQSLAEPRAVLTG
ncbi:MAG: hypothetical protein ACI9EF_003771 [Pseudohongiellaceae bacterium]|jgi:hypothetical protein